MPYATHIEFVKLVVQMGIITNPDYKILTIFEKLYEQLRQAPVKFSSLLIGDIPLLMYMYKHAVAVPDCAT